MSREKELKQRIAALEEMLAVSERKSDILTNLLKEASAEFERSLEKVTISEANFRAIFENAPEAIIILDVNTRQILDCNSFTLEWLGYRPREIVSLRYDDIIEPGGSNIESNIRKILDQGIIRILDRRFLKKDGTIVDSEVTGTTIEYQGTNCLLILARDVTERKKAQDALSESEQRFRDIASNLPDWIWEVNADWVYTYSSSGAENVLGFTAKEIIGKPLWDRMPAEDREAIGKILPKAGKAPHPFRLYESKRLHRNGRIVYLESSGVPLLDQSGRFMGYRGIHRDVTQRRLLEEFSRYKELFESVSDPVFIFDSKGRFLEINDVASDRLGYSRQEILSKMRIKDMVKPDQLSVLYQTGERIQKGEAIQFELEMLDRKGEVIPFEFHAKQILYKGRSMALSVGRDLSFRKKLEQTLVTTERLKAVGEMASGVAHNFNNLLQMILAAADAASAKLTTGNIREGGEAIKRIQDASQRAAEVVRRIKDFTRSREDLPEDRLTSFNIDELIRESLDLTAPLWKDLPDSRRYDLNLITAGNLYVKGKPSEIYEVIVNLIKNALEAMPRGGTLTVFVDSADDTVHIKISDTGQGIKEENLQRIFEPFFSTKGHRSSGLGLSSSYGIIKRHDGQILVESEPGKGTTFTVILPRSDAPVEIASEAVVSGNRSAIRFLMIDDEINILRAMEMFFEGSEIEVVTFRSAQDGLQAYLNDRFDVILCDLGMDDMSGWELGKLVKDSCMKRGVRKTPFLLYTGWDQRFDPKQLEASGIDRVVIKPVPCEELHRILHEMV